jgi:hypothetical protein
MAVLVVGLAACGADDGAGTAGGGDQSASSDAGAAAGGAADPDLTRDDVDCDAEALGESEEFEFIDAYYVIDGELGAVCYGDGDPTTERAWESLVTITPPDQLNDLALFAGFGAGGGADEEASGTTLAFVNVIDDEGTAFQMSVNLDAYDEDPEEAALTMAHEFSHVFSATASQLDRSPEAADNCDTYFNGEGCYLPDSLMAEWIAEFWGPEDLAAVDPDKDVGIDDGAELCAADPSFLGPYAASTPEEDFAESFAAFVYRVEAKTPEAQAKIDWFADQPGLVEFQQRAIDAGLGPLEGSFEGCGS